MSTGTTYSPCTSVFHSSWSSHTGAIPILYSGCLCDESYITHPLIPSMLMELTGLVLAHIISLIHFFVSRLSLSIGWLFLSHSFLHFFISRFSLVGSFSYSCLRLHLSIKGQRIHIRNRVGITKSAEVRVRSLVWSFFSPPTASLASWSARHSPL